MEKRCYRKGGKRNNKRRKRREINIKRWGRHTIRIQKKWRASKEV